MNCSLDKTKDINSINSEVNSEPKTTTLASSLESEKSVFRMYRNDVSRRTLYLGLHLFGLVSYFIRDLLWFEPFFSYVPSIIYRFLP